MLVTIKSVIVAILISLSIIYCTFLIGHRFGMMEIAEVARERAHAVDFYPVDPEVNRNLSIIRPYIQLCLQGNGAWMWHTHPTGVLTGGCTPGVEIQGNPQNEEEIEEAGDNDQKEVRSY